MAYSAPKWTQMTAPSGTTSVNALTSAGDLFSKAMDAASDGLKSYDKGVESRLQEDSDVNTAALRRRLESATDLDSLNAMQGDISASGLEGYGKRIDADALSASFNKERGVMRGEFENEFREDISRQYANAITPDEVRAVDQQVEQANQKNNFLDTSGLIKTGADRLQVATDLDTEQRTTQFGIDNRGKSFEELTAIIGNITGTDTAAIAKRQAAEAEQKIALTRETQVIQESFAAEQLTATTPELQKALQAKIEGLIKTRPEIDFSQMTKELGISIDKADLEQARLSSNELQLAAIDMSVDDLKKAQKKLLPGALNFEKDSEAYKDLIVARKDINQTKFDDDAETSMHLESTKGVKALEVERDRLLKEAKTNPDLNLSFIRSYFDTRREVALKSSLDNVASTARNKRTILLESNLNSFHEAKLLIPEKFRSLIKIDKLGNLDLDPTLPPDVAERFAKIATGFGYEGEGKNFVGRENEFFTAETSSLGADFSSLSEEELNLANDLRQRTRQNGLELSPLATKDLAKGTLAINEQHERDIKRVNEDYQSTVLNYAVDPAALKSAQNAKGNAFEHMVIMGFDENQEWLFSGDVTQDDLRTLIKDAKTEGYTDADIITAMDANTFAGGLWQDKQVDKKKFNEYLASQVDLKEKGTNLQKLLDARNIRDEALLKFRQNKATDLANATTGALSKTGQRNTARNAAILNRALGIK